MILNERPKFLVNIKQKQPSNGDCITTHFLQKWGWIILGFPTWQKQRVGIGGQLFARMTCTAGSATSSMKVMW